MTATSRFLWRVTPPDPDGAAALAEACGVTPQVAQVLINRGVQEPEAARRFLLPSLGQLDDPRQLTDMPAAIARIQHAVAAREPVLVFGDSDVDGITATAIVYDALQSLGAKVLARVSHRLNDGYGFPQRLIPAMHRAGIRVLVLVDCGTNQPDEIQQLARLGIDTVVLDHHVLSERPAHPLALVNPRREPIAEPCCSAGLAFKFAQALCPDDEARLARLLDLAALGTLADYVTLIGENRVLVAEGLRRIVDSARPGLRRLCADVALTKASPEHVLRKLVPRLNAAGRVSDPRPVWRLLVEAADAPAARLADRLAECHALSKSFHRRILEEAYAHADRMHFKDQHVMVIGRPGWHRGLMGPIAAQLVDRYNRPAISIALDGPTGVGSGRSVDGFDLFAALRACEPLLTRYGGHPQACGLSIDTDQVDALRERINDYARQAPSGRRGAQALTIDAEWTLEQMQRAGADLDALRPFGPGNPAPLVLVREVALEPDGGGQAMVDGEARIRLRVRVSESRADCRYDVVGTPSVSDGRVSFAVRDARESDGVERITLRTAELCAEPLS
jgi:single-stranded-DNA-specific exonuclease